MQKVEINQDFSYLRQFDKPEEFFHLSQEQRILLLDWCKQFVPIKTISSRHSSYGLKHYFEDSKNGFSLSNGALKGAMIILGFQIDDSCKTNWRFNISVSSVHKIKEGVV